MADSSIRHFHTKVVGVTQENEDGKSRQRILKSCKEMEQVVLLHDAENEYDEFAIEVRRTNGQQIGFLPSHTAESVAENIAAGFGYWAWIKNLTGGERSKKSRGANLLILEADAQATDADVQTYARNELGMKVGRSRSGCVLLFLGAVFLIVAAM
ncbi:MAG: HIRAN domain-containing protein [Planctomycetota bacterium]